MSAVIKDERELIAFARDLGAERFGGPLSSAETRTLTGSKTIRTTAATRTAIREQILAGRDPLGDALCSLRSPLKRRDTGTFYTPPYIVRPMVEWTLKQRPQRIIDLGCGSGRFSQRVVSSNPKVQLIAIDMDPVATLLMRAMLAALKANHAIVLNEDYLRFKITRFDGRTAYISNPPYVRHHELPPAVKRHAAKTAAKLGHSISGLAGLHALFFLQTAAIASQGDVGCFVTSAEWLDTKYGSIVRDLMTNGLGGRGVVSFSAEAVAFKDAMTTAAISYFQIGSQPTHISFLMSDDPKSRRALGAGGTPVEREALMKARRWSPMLKRQPLEGDVSIPKIKAIARVHRGTATGGNDFFVMSKHRARELGIYEFSVPVITRAYEIQEANGEIRDNEDRMVVLVVPPKIDRSAQPALDKYLKAGEVAHGGDEAICERWIPSHRRPWYSVKVSRPPIVATYMARSAVRFATNPDGLALLNVGHGIFPNEEMEPARLQEFVDRMNEMRNRFVGMGRTYHGGLEKFEPAEMESLPIPQEFAPKPIAAT